MSHLTYAEAIVTGLIQGVTELFPVSSLGHNVLLPALIGGQWAKDLNVSAAGSPYLAFIVGLHVATALAMIIYFWRDWVRIVRGFVSSLQRREIVTPDQRLAWMIVLATIPVGIAGLALQKVFTHVFAKPELTALFLAANGLILLYAERQRRTRDGGRSGGVAPATAGRPVQGGYPGYSQQPQQQQWQGPDPRYGQDDWKNARDARYGQDGREGQDPWDDQAQPGRDARYGQDPWAGQAPQPGRDARYGQDPWAGQAPQPGRDARYGQDPWAGQAPQPGRDARYGQAPQAGQDSRYTQDPWAGQAPQAGQNARYSQDPWAGQAPQAGQDTRYGQDPWAGQAPQAGQDPWGGRDDGLARNPRLAQERGSHRAAGAVGALDPAAENDAVVADRRLSVMGWGKAILVGSAQVLALLPGISRDGIVTVAGMGRGMSREDAVRFSFLLSAPAILAAGLLKAHDLLGPAGKGIHGPVIIGSLLSGIGAYLSVRFLTKYFSESRSLRPFGIYCLAAGLLSFVYLLIK
jgi:undecaprenyl pyrophosphate phosphatase UppP